jgi:hypothetical protein
MSAGSSSCCKNRILSQKESVISETGSHDVAGAGAGGVRDESDVECNVVKIGSGMLDSSEQAFLLV